MFKLIQSLWQPSPWKEVPASVYQQCFERYGGSFITHPEVIERLSTVCDMPLTFKAYYQGDVCLGAIALWGSFLAGSKQALKKAGKKGYIDVGNAEFIIPIESGQKLILPVKGDVISTLHCDDLLRLKPSRLSPLGIAKPPSDWRKKFRYNRNRELQHFESQGGRYLPITEYSADKLAELYIELFRKRWGFEATGGDNAARLFEMLQPWLIGHVLLVEDEPMALQVVFAAECGQRFSVEFVNGGYDPKWQPYSPGSILTFLNIQRAFEMASVAGLPLRYSFGQLGDGYKKQWCVAADVFKT